MSKMKISRPHELNMVLREIGIELNQQEMDLVFTRFDPDGGGDIEYQEFAWVFNNRRALKKAAQGKHSNLGKSQSLPNIQDALNPAAGSW